MALHPLSAAAGPRGGPRWERGLPERLRAFGSRLPGRLRGWRPGGPFFLTAEWRHLLILNYEIDKARLVPRVPRGTEIDDLRGRTFISFVGLLVLDARVLGVPIPFHQEFEQVNLRFYVRRRTEEGWRRGVAFVREIVPRTALAFAGRHLYGENCTAMPMRHAIDAEGGRLRPGGTVEYAWRHRGRWNLMQARASGEPGPPFPGSEEEFITERYWGYTARPGGSTGEYEVEHPPWEIRPATEPVLDCEVAGLYGPEFEAAVRAGPGSAFVALGSTVAVHRAARLPGPGPTAGGRAGDGSRGAAAEGADDGATGPER